jgi:hypothetical protein
MANVKVSMTNGKIYEGDYNGMTMDWVMLANAVEITQNLSEGAKPEVSPSMVIPKDKIINISSDFAGPDNFFLDERGRPISDVDPRYRRRLRG